MLAISFSFSAISGGIWVLPRCTRDPVSSRASMALSGIKRSVTYRSVNLTHAISASVMMLIAVLDVPQNLQCLLVGRRLHLYLLETTLQRTVLLDGVTVFVKCRGSDTLNGASCQCRFHNVGSIHRTGSRTGTDDGVDLVDEHDHIGICLQFLHQGFQTFLKLSTILRTGHLLRRWHSYPHQAHLLI